ncbi:MAG: hypothetical protein R3F35_15925 [Myxococcota bacterium]
MSRPEAHGPAGWGRGTTVSVSRLPGPDAPMARPLGMGELLTRIEVGHPIRLRIDAVDGGRVLVATTVLRIEAQGPDTLRISTRNHRYELRRVAGSLAVRGGMALPVTGGPIDGPTEHGDRTRVVEIADWPEAAPGRFEAGARITLVHARDGEERELGRAILLTALVPGESASFSVDGRVVSTSLVREVIALGKGAARIVTGNSSYRLELDPPTGDCDDA